MKFKIKKPSRAKLQALTLRNSLKELALFRFRLFIGLLMVLIMAAGLIARLVYLQIDQHRYYVTLSDKNQIDLVPIPPQRGLIYDRHGVLLAKNVPVFSLMVTLDQTNNLKEELKELNKIIPLTPTELKAFHKQAKVRRQFQQVLLKVKLTEAQVALFAVNRYRFPGFSVEAELLREYPYGPAFSHILGYVGRINVEELQKIDPANYAETNYIGKTGIEKFYEAQLHGTVGYQRVESDASGEVVRTLGVTPPVAGSDLYLTIDSRLQMASEAALGDHRGAIVAIDPNNGQVLAMVSKPGFDPNLFVQGISQEDYTSLTKDPNHPLYNRTIRGLYAMGSTIKPYIGLQALDTGIVSTTYRIFDRGVFSIPGTTHIFRDWKKGGHGWVNFRLAIAQSCDVYFYNVAYNMGILLIDDIMSKFGFGQRTQIDLPGELPGTLPSPDYKRRVVKESWYRGDTVNSVIGQGFWQATPLQIAVAAATLANRGIHHAPYLLYAMQTGAQKLVRLPAKNLPPVILKHPENWNIVISAMQDVVTQGTAKSFGKTPYTIAGKTGTAQVRSSNGQLDIKVNSEDELSNSWFIAFAPVDHPQIAVAVLVEHSPHTAVLVARHVIDTYLLSEKHFMPPTPATPVVANAVSIKK